MSKTENTLVNGMFVREHTFNSGTTIYKVQINCADFIQMMENNAKGDRKGNKWINLNLIPNKNTTKYSHTSVVDTWEPKTADKAIETLATEVIEDKQPVALPF